LPSYPTLRHARPDSGRDPKDDAVEVREYDFTPLTMRKARMPWQQ